MYYFNFQLIPDTSTIHSSLNCYSRNLLCFDVLIHNITSRLFEQINVKHRHSSMNQYNFRISVLLEFDVHIVPKTNIRRFEMKQLSKCFLQNYQFHEKIFKYIILSIKTSKLRSMKQNFSLISPKIHQETIFISNEKLCNVTKINVFVPLIYVSFYVQ